MRLLGLGALLALAACGGQELQPAPSASSPRTFPQDKKTAASANTSPAPPSPAESCAAGDFEACLAWGRSRLKTDAETAKKALLRACEEGGKGEGCAELANHLEMESGPSREARHLYERACELKSGSGCAGLGNVYMAGVGVARDGARGVELYRKGCELDSSAACFLLGQHLQAGRAVEQDLDGARTALEKACKLGLARACASR